MPSTVLNADKDISDTAGKTPFALFVLLGLMSAAGIIWALSSESHSTQEQLSPDAGVQRWLGRACQLDRRAESMQRLT